MVGLRWFNALKLILRPRPERADVVVKRALRSCGENVVIRMPCVIESSQNVEIQSDVSIASYLHIWGNGGVHIGNRTMIGSHVAITSATHDPSAPIMSATLISAPVVIENDVWIGAHCVIFPGVTIGEHSIVAAGSVVRASVPAYSVVAGVPARVIKVRTQSEQSENKVEDNK